MKVKFGMRLDGAPRRLRWAGHALAEEIDSRNRRDRTRAVEPAVAARREDGR